VSVMKGACYYEKNNFSDKKETIVFLHGLTGTSDAWQKYFDYYKKDYNVIRIDLLGHGRSRRPYAFNRYRVYSLALSVLEVLDKEKIKNANFVCHSFSYLVSLELHKIRKKMFRSFVFISPFAPNNKRTAWKVTKFISLLLGWSVYLVPTIGKYRLSDYHSRPITKEIDIRRAFSDIVNTGFKSYVGLNYYAIRYDDLDFAKEIEVPVLIMSGENDGIVYWEDVKTIAGKISTSTLIKLENRDHMILSPHFNELVALMDEFFFNLK